MQQYILYINFRRLIRENISAFTATRKLGYKIALISTELPEKLAGYIDKHIFCDTADLGSLIAQINLLREQIHIVGVVCITEMAIESSSIVANKLNLIGLPKVAIESVRNKSILRERTKHLDILPVSIISDDQNISSFINDFGMPVIVKPINTSGSTGIYVIKQDSDLAIFFNSRNTIENPIYDLTIKQPRLKFVIEKYIEGQEVSVEGYVLGKKTIIVGITYKITADPFKLEVRHIFPAPVTEQIQHMIEKKTKEYIQALNLDNTSFHLEGKYDEKSFTLIEVAARPGGGYITSHLIPFAKGYNFYRNLVKVSVGEAPEIVPQTYEIAGTQYILAAKEGNLEGYTGIDQVLCHPWVKHVFVEIPIGTHIMLPPKDFHKQRLIAVISTAPNHALLINHLNWVATTIKPIIN